MAPTSKILVLGAGELGTPVLLALAQHPNVIKTKNSSDNISVSVLLRPSTITSSSPEKAKELQRLRDNNISFVPGDIASDSTQALSSIFKQFDTVISCTGFAAGPGTQRKLTRAVLDAGVARYIPWQFGVDYDTIGRGSGHDLFDEQLDVRDALRSQRSTKWAIISTGMFTSFLFEPSSGIVDLGDGVVTALGGLGNRVTVTAPDDIGRVTAEVVLGDYGVGFEDGPVYVAGDTLSYGRLAEIVEGVKGRKVERRVRTVEAAREDLVRDTENALYKYQIVFGEGKGVAWDVEETWNYKHGIRLQTAEEWARENLS